MYPQQQSSSSFSPASPSRLAALYAAAAAAAAASTNLPPYMSGQQQQPHIAYPTPLYASPPLRSSMMDIASGTGVGSSTVDNVAAAAAIRRRPSLMSDFFPTSAQPMSQDPKRMLSLHVDMRRPTIQAYTPQVENISPTPDDQPMEMPGKKLISEKLEKVEREIKHADAQIRQLEKRKQDLEESSRIGVVDSHGVEPENDKQSSMFDRIYAENRKRAAEWRSKFTQMNMLPDAHIIPLYHEPWDLQVVRDTDAKHEKFRPILLQYVRKLQQARELRERYLTERYNALMASWRKKNERWEKNPKKIKEAKNREIFEKTFPELRRAREERERTGRTERLGQTISMTSVRANDSTSIMTDASSAIVEQVEEERKMRQVAVIPPMLLDERTRQRLFFDNRNGIVTNAFAEHRHRIETFLACWTDDEKRIFKERLMMYGKNFAAVSMFLDRKDTKDCVWFYYLTKKRESYKQLMGKRKKKQAKMYRAPFMPRPEDVEASGNDGDDAIPARQDRDHDCVVCKTKIDPGLNPGRVLTRACYEMYGLDAVQPNPTDVRVCQKCRLGVLKNKYARCPIGTCTTARRKVKPTRPMPPKSKHLSMEHIHFLNKLMQIPEDATKCCSGCHKKISRKIEQLLCGELNKEMADFFRSSWTHADAERLRVYVGEMNVTSTSISDKWDAIAARMGPDRTADECRMEYEKISSTADCNSADKSSSAVPKVPGIESEDEDNSDYDASAKKLSLAESINSMISIKLESPCALNDENVPISSGESNATLSADEALNDDDHKSRHIRNDPSYSSADGSRSNGAADLSQPYKPRFRLGTINQTSAKSQLPTNRSGDQPKVGVSVDVQSVVSGIVASEIEREFAQNKQLSPDVQIIGHYGTTSAPTMTSNIRSTTSSIRQSVPTSSARGSITQGTPMIRAPTMMAPPLPPMQPQSSIIQQPRVSAAPYDFHHQFASNYSTTSADRAPTTDTSSSSNNRISPLLMLPTSAYPTQHDAGQQQQLQAARAAQAQIDLRNVWGQLNNNSSTNQSSPQIDYRAALPTSSAAQQAAAHAQLQQQMQSVQIAQIQADAQRIYLQAKSMRIPDHQAWMMYQSALLNPRMLLPMQSQSTVENQQQQQQQQASGALRSQQQLMDDYRYALQMPSQQDPTAMLLQRQLQQQQMEQVARNVQADQQRRQLAAHQQRLQKDQEQALLNAKHAERTHQAAMMGQQISRAQEASRQRDDYMAAAAVAEHNRRALAHHQQQQHQQQQTPQQQMLGISPQIASISPGPHRKSGAVDAISPTANRPSSLAAAHAQQIAALQQQVWLQHQQAFAAAAAAAASHGVIQPVPTNSNLPKEDKNRTSGGRDTPHQMIMSKGAMKEFPPSLRGASPAAAHSSSSGSGSGVSVIGINRPVMHDATLPTEHRTGTNIGTGRTNCSNIIETIIHKHMPPPQHHVPTISSPIHKVKDEPSLSDNKHNLQHRFFDKLIEDELGRGEPKRKSGLEAVMYSGSTIMPTSTSSTLRPPTGSSNHPHHRRPPTPHAVDSKLATTHLPPPSSQVINQQSAPPPQETKIEQHQPEVVLQQQPVLAVPPLPAANITTVKSEPSAPPPPPASISESTIIRPTDVYEPVSPAESDSEEPTIDDAPAATSDATEPPRTQSRHTPTSTRATPDIISTLSSGTPPVYTVFSLLPEVLAATTTAPRASASPATFVSSISITTAPSGIHPAPSIDVTIPLPTYEPQSEPLSDDE